jgi:tRNA (cmo5U34)-methyltransferase
MNHQTDRPDELVNFDDEFSTEYDQKIRISCPGYDSLHTMLPQLLKALPQDASFLSAGAGTGMEILTLGKQFPSWQFAAVDPSDSMLSVCKKRIQNASFNDRVEFFNTRLEEFHYHQPMDGASSVFVSHFIQTDDLKLAFFKAIAKCLRAGGTLITADLVGGKSEPEFQQLFNGWMTCLELGGASEEELAEMRSLEHKLRWMPEQDYCAIIEQAGFSKPVRFFQSYLWHGYISTKLP